MCKSQIRFKTIESALALVREFKFYDEFHDLKNNAYVVGELVAVHTAYMAFYGLLGRELRDWSRTYRRSHGKKAVVDDFLRMNLEQIRSMLLGLEKAVDAMDNSRYNGEKREVFNRARSALYGMWALDLDGQPPARLLPKTQEEKMTALAEDLLDGLDLSSPLGMFAWALRGVLAKNKHLRGKVNDTETSLPTTPLPIDTQSLIDALDAALAGEGLGGEVAGD